MKKRVKPMQFWVGFLLFLAVLLILLINSGRKTQDLPRAAYADKSPLGGRGLRLVMEKLGYTTARQTDPLQKMPADARVWLILDPETGFSKAEASILLDWVRRGGILVFCLHPEPPVFSFGEDEAQNSGIESLRTRLNLERSRGQTDTEDFLPALKTLSLDAVSIYRSGVNSASGSSRDFVVSRPALAIAASPGGNLVRIDLENAPKSDAPKNGAPRNAQSGPIFVAPDALLFTNLALSKLDNARLVTNLIRVHAPRGKIYFDERKHGDLAAPIDSPPTLIRLLKRPPASYAILQILAAGLLFWGFAGRRLGAPVPLPSRSPVTRASQFAGAMGALFQKINRPQAASQLIGARFRRRLATRLGLSPAEIDSVLARRAQEVAGIPFEVTDRLLLQSQTPSNNLNQALRDAQEMERVLQQLEGR